MAATADLPNELTELPNGLTNYDKDVENLKLLRQLASLFPELDTTRLQFDMPTDMGVNVIDRAITNESMVAKACKAEIIRRLHRYEQEIMQGNEVQDTFDRTKVHSEAS